MWMLVNNFFVIFVVVGYKIWVRDGAFNFGEDI